MRLTVFLLRGASLRLYEDMGLLERELALYRRLAAQGVRVAVVTWGDRRDLAFRARLRGIRVLCNWPGWDNDTYERRLAWLHAPWLWLSDLVKADQTDGADAALWSARRWRRPVVARCGYLHALNVEREFGARSLEAVRADQLSRRVFAEARHLVVTTGDMADFICGRYNVVPDKITIIPNYVDTDLFCPGKASATGSSALAVGRLSREKNHAMLIEALRGTGLELTLVGTGPEEPTLRAAAASGAAVRFAGSLLNRELPPLIRASALFVQPSLYEGHPKTVIEAMACGAAVIGTDVPGLRDVIRHGETGWLCPPTVEGLRDALRRLAADAALRARLGAAAAQFVAGRFALKRIAEQELNLYKTLLAD